MVDELKSGRMKMEKFTFCGWCFWFDELSTAPIVFTELLWRGRIKWQIGCYPGIENYPRLSITTMMIPDMSPNHP